MDFKKKIAFINSLKLDERIEYVDELLDLVSKFENINTKTITLGLNIVDCLQGIRTSRFIESDTDIKLLEASLKITRSLKSQKKLLKGLLNDAIYYSGYYPKKYNKSELEKELAEIESSTT